MKSTQGNNAMHYLITNVSKIDNISSIICHNFLHSWFLNTNPNTTELALLLPNDHCQIWIALGLGQLYNVTTHFLYLYPIDGGLNKQAIFSSSTVELNLQHWFF